MSEIDFLFKFPEGNLVKNGRIPEYIPSDVIYKMVEKKPVIIFDKALSNYFQLKLMEHEIIYEGTQTGWSARRNDELAKKRRKIHRIEEENPTFRSQITNHLNSVISSFR